MAGPGRSPGRTRGLMRGAVDLALPAALALLLLLLCLAPPPSACLSLPFLKHRQAAQPEDALIAWVRSHGANLSVRVGPIPGRGGLRGMMAAVAVPKGALLVALPSNLSVPMGTIEYTTPVRERRKGKEGESVCDGMARPFFFYLSPGRRALAGGRRLGSGAHALRTRL